MGSTITKTRTFVVPKEFISPFFQELENTELKFDLGEVDEDGDLSVKVKYTSDERDQIMNLVELEDEYYGEEDDDDEEEEELDAE